MTPEQIQALGGLVESLGWVAFFGGMLGAACWSMAGTLVRGIVQALPSPQYRQYRAASREMRRTGDAMSRGK